MTEPGAPASVGPAEVLASWSPPGMAGVVLTVLDLDRSRWSTARSWALLDDAERATAERLATPRLAARFVARRAAVRHLLAARTGDDPAEVAIMVGPRGKLSLAVPHDRPPADPPPLDSDGRPDQLRLDRPRPDYSRPEHSRPDQLQPDQVRSDRLQLNHPRPDDPPQSSGASYDPGAASGKVAFNVSHSRNLCVVAVGTSGAIGVDLEHLSDQPSAGMVDLVLGPAEQVELDERPGGRSLGFLRAWTRKEAMVKAIGIGLTVPLLDLRVDLTPEWRLARWPSGPGYPDVRRCRWADLSVASGTGAIACLALMVIDGDPPMTETITSSPR